MNTQEAILKFEASVQQRQIQVQDNTDEFRRGMTISIVEDLYMVMFVLNENDLSVIPIETAVLH